MREKTNLMQKSIEDLTSKALPLITITKIDEITQKLRKISNLKSELEDENKALR
jgi:hypothetical protein